jgi:hypothetical protein
MSRLLVFGVLWVGAALGEFAVGRHALGWLFLSLGLAAPGLAAIRVAWSLLSS